jgi:CRISPR-associated protein (TIGR02710 family)
VVFVCSADTRGAVGEKILPGIAEQGISLGPAQYSVVEVSDPQNLASCVREMEAQVTPHVRDWRAHDAPACSVTVDPTGGTKLMSIALGLIARRWECTFRYVGGAARRQGAAGPGVVVNGAETILHSDNPLDFLGYQVADDALTLCGGGDYAAATALLEGGGRRARDPGVKRSLFTLASLAGAFADWDRFAHADAGAGFAGVEKNRGDLERYLAPETCLLVERELPGWKQRLETLAAGQPSPELIEDLLANAARRRAEHRYDDAVARLYRSVEAMAQWRLASSHQIPDTGAVALARLREEMRSKVVPQDDGTAKLGLQSAYELLAAFGDRLGAVFREEHLDNPKRSPLAHRNASILAHGWQPVSERACESLWKSALRLAAELNISEQRLFRFPELKSKSA